MNCTHPYSGWQWSKCSTRNRNLTIIRNLITIMFHFDKLFTIHTGNILYNTCSTTHMYVEYVVLRSYMLRFCTYMFTYTRSYVYGIHLPRDLRNADHVDDTLLITSMFRRYSSILKTTTFFVRWCRRYHQIRRQNALQQEFAFYDLVQPESIECYELYNRW